MRGVRYVADDTPGLGGERKTHFARFLHVHDSASQPTGQAFPMESE
jgi:hypothetical protein